MTSKDLLFIVFGAILGFGLTIWLEHIKRQWEQRDRFKRAQQLLSAIIIEIENGIKRCERLVFLRDESLKKVMEKQQNKIDVSPSRIYTSLWDSMMFEFSECIKETKILKLLHSIYSNFDLVNFNMERNDFLMGANFAADKLSYIKTSLSEIKDCLPLSSPLSTMEEFKILARNILRQISTDFKKK
jgi:hypothetical protein